MDIRGVFFQTSIDDDIAPMEGSGLRKTVTAPCPGNKSNLVTVAEGWNCLDFLDGNLINIGKCKSYVVLFDKTGTFLLAYELAPDAALWRVRDSAPANTHFIKFGCDPKCGGDAILEFDAPYS